MNHLSKSPIKLFISTPCYDAMMTMQYTMSILNLNSVLQNYGIEYVIDFMGNESLIPRARNSSLAKFMDSEFTHILFIDSDIEFPAQAVIDLLDFDKDVVCCAYSKKSFNWKRFMYSMQTEIQSKESLESRGLDYNYNAIVDEEKELIKSDNGRFIRVKHASTGFMMVKREIVNKLCRKHTELTIKTDNLSKEDKAICGLFCCMIKDKIYLSEDYSFCERVNDIGGEVWLNITHNLNHIGKFIFKSDIQNRENLLRSIKERKCY
mgnify:CR=1 FL=1|jgi:hypothetical protein|tara:strand:+ start:542 stop:1333 length:792 start_codon:yes stop_codon:yes gene_type:complete